MVTLKSSLGVTQGHWSRYYSKAWVRFHILFHSNYGSILYYFRGKASNWSKIAIFFIRPLHLTQSLYSNCDSSTIRVRFEHDSSTACYNTLRGFPCARIQVRYEHHTRIAWRCVIQLTDRWRLGSHSAIDGMLW